MEKILNLGLEATKAISEPAIAKTSHIIRQTVENGSEKSMQFMESTGNALISIVKKSNSTDEMSSKLRARLTTLNSYRMENNPNCTERFGKDGISSILDCARTSEDIKKINHKLDELEQGRDIWTYDITSMFQSRRASHSGKIDSIEEFLPYKANASTRGKLENYTSQALEKKETLEAIFKKHFKEIHLGKSLNPEVIKAQLALKRGWLLDAKNRKE